jgi:putative tryptophan/tyrosine transport system substrate-binding protein
MTTRRALMVLGASAFAAPFAAIAQQPGKVWRVGFLLGRHLDFVDTDYSYGPFRQGMRELGYVEGKNLVIEWRSAEGKPERLAALAAELVNLKVDVIVTGGAPPAHAAQKVTATIPIVLGGGGDPVRDGLVKSLARPGGNITGLSNLNADIGPKLLELLISMVPKLSRVVVLGNADNTNLSLKGIQTAAQRTSIRILPSYASTVPEIEQAFAAMARDRAGAVMVLREPFLNQQTRLIAQQAARYKLPAIAGLREFADAGGLMSYGSSITEQYRRAATYVDKIFKGAKPGDLPVEQPTKFELVINGKTAKTLGLTIPYALRISATQVIE